MNPLIRPGDYLLGKLFRFCIDVFVRDNDQAAPHCPHNQAGLVDVDVPVSGPLAAALLTHANLAMSTIVLTLLFQNDAKFENGLKKFQASHSELPSCFGGYLEEQRVRWQNRLADWRNKCLEHPSLTGWENFESLYEVSQAEVFFECAWNAIVIILAVLLRSKLWPGWALLEIPEAERNPNFPNRFRFVPPSNSPLNSQPLRPF